MLGTSFFLNFLQLFLRNAVLTKKLLPVLEVKLLLFLLVLRHGGIPVIGFELVRWHRIDISWVLGLCLPGCTIFSSNKLGVDRLAFPL